MRLPQRYFDHLYRTDADPWQFRSRPYEARKRALTLASLPEDRYASTFEPGCSIGVLTALLATRSDRVLAMDISPLALTTAGQTVPANVELRRGGVPDDWPVEPFDLVVLSEVAYYLDAADCTRLAELAVDGARDLLAVHWRHPVSDYPLGGGEVHDLLAATAERAGLGHLVSHEEDDFLLDVWSYDRRSVAARTALVER